MNADEIIKVIDHLKDVITPIGVEVYEIYYKQMFYSGIIQFILCCTMVLLSIIIIYKYIKNSENFNTYIRDHDLELIVFICTIIWAFLLLGSLVSVPMSLMKVINPDYYVIQTLIGNI